MINVSDLQTGDQIPSLSRVGSFQHWNRYAAANYEFADHHMDDEVGRYEGFTAAIGMAPLIHACLHTMLRNWIDPNDGRVVSVAIQLRSPWLRKKTMTAEGTVKEVRREADETFVTLDVWTRDDEGNRLALGAAEVALRTPSP